MRKSCLPVSPYAESIKEWFRGKNILDFYIKTFCSCSTALLSGPINTSTLHAGRPTWFAERLCFRNAFGKEPVGIWDGLPNIPGFSWSFTLSSLEFHGLASNRQRSPSFGCSNFFYLLTILPDHFKDVYIDAVDTIKMDLKEIGWEWWTGLNWLRFVRAVINFQLT